MDRRGSVRVRVRRNKNKLNRGPLSSRTVEDSSIVDKDLAGVGEVTLLIAVALVTLLPEEVG